MPEAPREVSPAPRLPVLPEGAAFDGRLVLPGPARIDGHVRGEILAASDLWVGPTGRVQADLEVRSIVIEGRVEGDVSASERIELRGAGQIQGSLRAPRLVVADGCRVDGSCTTGPPVTRHSPRSDGREAPQPRVALP